MKALIIYRSKIFSIKKTKDPLAKIEGDMIEFKAPDGKGRMNLRQREREGRRRKRKGKRSIGKSED